MSIARLTSLIPPPGTPTEVKSIKDWNVIESELGLILPTDYREFVFTYGSGLFARFYRVYNPFSASQYTSLRPSVRRVGDALREFKRDFPDRVPYPIFPESLGLLPWGNDENGNDYYWITKGHPDEWRVISDEVRGEGFREYGCKMTEFLENVLLGKLEALAGDYPAEDDLVFKPFAPTID